MGSCIDAGADYEQETEGAYYLSRLRKNNEGSFAFLDGYDDSVTEREVMKLVDYLLDETGIDDSWPYYAGIKCVLSAYIGFMIFYCIREEQNFKSVVTMLNEKETEICSADYKSAKDMMFDDIKNRSDSFPCFQYDTYKSLSKSADIRRYVIRESTRIVLNYVWKNDLRFCGFQNCDRDSILDEYIDRMAGNEDGKEKDENGKAES